MDINKLLKIGDRARITVNGGSYGTLVEKAADDGGFYIALPQNGLATVSLKKGRIYPMSVTAKNGILIFRVRVDGTDLSDNIPLARVTAVDEPKRVQRRKSYRTNVMLDVTVRKTGGGETEETPTYETKALNISEDGMLLLSGGLLEAGDTIECDISLDRFGMSRKLEGIKARVTRVEAAEDGKQKAAVHFADCPGKSRDLLLKFVVFSQRKKSNE